MSQKERETYTDTQREFERTSKRESDLNCCGDDPLEDLRDK